MLSLMNRAFEPSLLYSDKITYLTSIRYLQSVRADNGVAVAEKIKDLITTKNTRLQGLQFLEIALQQNPEIYLKGRWTAALFEIIKEPVSSVLKDYVCKILCMLIPYMAKDVVANAAELLQFSTFLFPFLLSEVENKVEWIESAGMCLRTCLKCFPQALESQRDRLLKVIFQQISYSVSSRTFEVFAECFCLIPSCMRQLDPNIYAENWTNQYLTTVNSMHYMINTFVTFFTEDPDTNTSIPGICVFPFEEDEEDTEVYPAYIKGVRRFINLSKCLAKMLSTKSRFSVQVPLKLTLECIIRLFQIHNICKITATSLEMQIIVSTLSQMQIASLVTVESLILNFAMVPYSFLISQMLTFALQASNLPNISSESVSPLRQAVWKLLDLWVSRHGAKVSSDIVSDPSIIMEELLKDIGLEDSSSEIEEVSPSKSKKNIDLHSVRKTFVCRNQQSVCKEALKTLENLVYSAAGFFSRKMLMEIFNKVIGIAYAIAPPDDSPFPYDDDICRKLLYSVVLAIAVICKSDHIEPIQRTNGIFKIALQDPSPKVVRLCHKAMALCRLYVHPKKPLPIVKDLSDRRRVRNTVCNFNEWSTEGYMRNVTHDEATPNIAEEITNLSENLTAQIAQTFHNPNAAKVPSKEYIQAHYSEQAAESQCNGEDILEIQNSSQCQDDVDSDDEDEEEDDERSYGEEEMNQEVEMQAEHIYIPSTSKMQVLTPVHITPDTEQNVGEQEYEELRPRGKHEDSNKNMHLNGVLSSIVPEEGMSSSSVQNVASENGIYGLEDEDIEEEEGEEDDEEEENIYPAEKKISEYFEPPTKKQKVDSEVEEEPQEEREDSRSPTLLEMKADFCCNEIEDVKS